MIVTDIKRTFTFNDIQLEDINPNLSTDMVLSHYANIYPELTTAEITNKGLQPDGNHAYSFDLNIGTKG